MDEFERFELPNGLRVIYKAVKSEASHCGIIINAGTRDEEAQEQGLAHFIEHTLFKGTHKRKFYHILNRIDSVGGELNAYTAKEETCLYASFQNQYIERAVELIADITFHATFPEKEINKEKDIILDEINAYKDTPAEQIYDDFESFLFQNNALGNNILGTVESVKSFKRKHIQKFIQDNYTLENMVFSLVGNYKIEFVKKILTKHLGHFQHQGKTRIRKTPHINKAFHEVQTIYANQAHFIIGNRAPSICSRKRNTMFLLNNIIGGPGMNSRLNLNIREKYGFAYNLDTSYVAYSDSGLFVTYLGTDKKYLPKTIALIHKEFDKMKNQTLSSLQLHRAKQQVKGNIALAQENNSALMLTMGKSLLLFNKIDPLSKVYAEMDRITAQQLLDVANQVFDCKHLSTLTLI